MYKKILGSKYAVMLLASLVLSGAGVTFSHEDSMHVNDAEVVQPALNAEEKRVVTMLENYAKAVQSGDIAEIGKYILSNDLFTSLDGANQEDSAFHEYGTFLDLGWDNYRKHLAAELPMLKNSQYTLSEIRAFVHGDLAYSTMNYAMTFTIKSDQFKAGERQFTMKGRATMVLWKTGGEWKIRHRHTTPGKS